MHIEILLSFKNYVLVKDTVTGWIWLYSYNKPIAYCSCDKFLHICKDNLTITNKRHISVFKEWLNI